jgi:hypothetical protein
MMRKVFLLFFSLSLALTSSAQNWQWAKHIVSASPWAGEMNAKLLQKIEELALYLIDLQKQVDELKGGKK